MQLQSEQINDLVTALAKAQGEMGLAVKDAKNPHFNSEYASLGSYILASKTILSKHGLAVIQGPLTHDGRLYLITTLAHASGQWFRSETPILSEKQTAQGMGSGISYARRYALSAIVGLADKDDDGSIASLEGSDVSRSTVKPPQVSHSHHGPTNGGGGPGAYVLTMGKLKGLTLDEAGPGEATSLLNWIQNLAPANVRGSAKGKTEIMAIELFLKLKGNNRTKAMLAPEPIFTDDWPSSKDAPQEEELPF